MNYCPPTGERAATMDRPSIVFFALFIFIYKGLACNPGWTANNGKCYLITEFRYDIRMARRYCQVYGGDLAYIDSTLTFSFLRSLEHYDIRDYWVKENSTIIESSGRLTTVEPPNGCPYITGEEFLYSDCEEPRFSICELEEENTNIECPKTWHLYGTTCYKPMPDTNTYEKAVDTCAIQRGSLAILDDIDKEHHVASVILGRNTTFMVGAQVVGEAIVWRNGKKFIPSCSQCIINSTGECLGFQSSAEHPTVFSWVHLNCNSMNNYLCEIPPSLRPTTQPSTLSPTTQPPLHCPHGFNWKSHEASGFCYWETTYETERLNWYQAQTFCKTLGGDLATYQDSRQELVGLGGAKGHYRGLWFGLKRSTDNVFSWVDGLPLSYTNWGYREPKLSSNSKFCVMHGADESKWELDYCGVRRWFICKAPKTRRVTIPDMTGLFKKTQCNLTTSSLFNGWYQYEDHCYMVRLYSTYSWHTAQNFCHDNGAQLLSVHSFEETDFVIFLLSMTTERNFWMGLSARGIDSAIEWSDGTPVDFFYWPNEDTRNKTYAVDVCFAFNSLKGYWVESHCNEFKSVVCKRGLNSSQVFTPPEPTPLLLGYCPKNWYQLGNKCYRVYGSLRSQRLNFQEATASCQSEGAGLVSIHSEEEQDFLIDLLLLYDTGAWIGLSSSNRGNVYKWNDDSPIDYTIWNQFTTAEEASCVELLYGDDFRKWSASQCQRTKAYICQKAKDPTLTKPSENPFKCSNITDWYKLGSMCYGIFETQEVSWVAAQQKCREFDANLASFQNKAVGIFIKKKLTKKDNFLWIGVRQTQRLKYGLVNGQNLKHTQWLSKQPRQVSSQMENCVVMNSEAKWIVKQCQESHGFICEWNSDRNSSVEPVVIDVKNSCPNTSNWVYIGGNSCYLFCYDLPRRWVEAMLYCHQHGGFLASFHSQEEQSIVIDYLSDKYDTNTFLIGLARNHDGSASWIDGSPVDFTKWDSQEEFQFGHCVAMSIRTDSWISINCYGPRHAFICSTPVNRDSDQIASLKDFPFEQVTHEDISNKLTIGGIFGIIICVLVVVAIIGVAAYYTCPSTRMLVPLEETDSL